MKARVPGVTVDHDPAVIEFITWGIRRRRWADTTCGDYARLVRGFRRWCHAQGVRPHKATTANVQAYMDTVHPTVAVHTRVRTALAAYYDYVVDRGTRTTNPVEGIPRLPVKRALPRAFDRDSAERLLGVASTHGPKRHLYIGLLLYAGLRRNEARLVEWSHLEHDSEGGLWLRVVNGKGGWQRILPVHDDLAALFTRWRAEAHSPRWVFPGRYPGEPISTATCTKWARTIADEAGMPDVSSHSCRHTYATRMIEQGVDVPTVSEALGHRNLGATMVYTRSRPAKVAEAVRQLDF